MISVRVLSQRRILTRTETVKTWRRVISPFLSPRVRLSVSDSRVSSDYGALLLFWVFFFGISSPSSALVSSTRKNTLPVRPHVISFVSSAPSGTQDSPLKKRPAVLQPVTLTDRDVNRRGSVHSCADSGRQCECVRVCVSVCVAGDGDAELQIEAWG